MDAIVLEQEALKLTFMDRALLADHLLQTLGCEDEAVMNSWAEEAERRLGLLNNGNVEALDGKAVVDSLRKNLR